MPSTDVMPVVTSTDLPAESTQIDASTASPPGAERSRESDGTAVESPRGRRSASLPAVRVPAPEDDDDEPSFGSGVARLSPEAEERFRLGYAATLAVPAFTVQPESGSVDPARRAAAALVSTADGSTAIPTQVQDRSAAHLLHVADASTAAPTLAKGPAATETPPARDTPAPLEPPIVVPERFWTLAAVTPPPRRFPVGIVVAAGIAALVAAVIVVVVLVGGSDDVPSAPAPTLPALPPRGVPQHVTPGVPATGPTPAPAPVPGPSAPSTSPSTSASSSEVPALPPERPRKNRNVGRLRLTSTPRGTVYIDGQRVADSTPLIGYPLDPGLHRIRVVNDHSHRSATIAVRTRAGYVYSRHVRLKRNPRMR